jgi:hypothetical protein
MKKIVYPIILSIALLGSCAKITQDPLPCTGAKPASPAVPDVILALGSSTYVNPVTYQGVTVRWTGPNNFSSTQNPLNLDFSNATNYGLYTVTVFVNGCASTPDTFHVQATVIVPCTVSSANYLNISNGAGENFSYASSLYNSYLASTYCQQYTNTSDNGTPLTMYFNTPYSTLPTAAAFSLDSTGSFRSGSCYVQLGNSPYVSHSISGNVYPSIIGSYATCMIFCSAKFKTYQGTYFTITGAVPYSN